MKAKFTLLGLLLSCCFVSVFAQQTSSFYVNAGLALHAIQDQGHSPLMYTGTGLMYGAAYRTRSENTFSGVDFATGKASLAAQLEEESSFGLNQAKRRNMRASYYHLRKLPIQKIGLYVGGALSGLYDFIPFNHSANNLVGYELTASVGPAVRLEYEISSHFKLAFQASTALFSYGLRPYHDGFFPIKDLELHAGKIIENGEFATVDKAFQLQTRTILTITPRQAKSFNLFYEYAGGVNKLMERKGAATQTIGLEIPIGLK